MREVVVSAAKGKCAAASIHLLVSGIIAAVMAVLVFGLWYPRPLDALAGGQQLFMLLMACDLVLGPLVTFIVFNRIKPKRELTRDLMIVVAVQIAALAYGVWTVYIARPAYLVFERDQFRVVRWVDIPEQKLGYVSQEFVPVLWQGPRLLGLRDFKDQHERLNTTAAEIAGLPMGAMPEFWRDYASEAPRVLERGRALERLAIGRPQQRQAALHLVLEAGLRHEDVVAHPLVQGTTVWTMLVARPDGRLVGVLPFDPDLP